MESEIIVRIHFLNVGHGDCCIVEFDSGNNTMVDINNAEDIEAFTLEEMKCIVQESSDNICELKVTNPIQYMQDNNINDLFRFVITHPHMDHMDGISLIRDMCTNVWVRRNEFEEPSNLSETQSVDWKQYAYWRKHIGEKKLSPKVLSLSDGACASYYKEDGISILSPNEDLVKAAEEKNNRNIMSTVLLIKYYNYKIVLGGDAEEETWKYIMAHYKDAIKDVTILKASHHGRDSGYYQEAVKQMNPQYVIVSVGKKPETDASNKYRQYSKNVYSTRWKGNIVFEIKKNSIKCITEYDH